MHFNLCHLKKSVFTKERERGRSPMLLEFMRCFLHRYGSLTSLIPLIFNVTQHDMILEIISAPKCMLAMHKRNTYLRSLFVFLSRLLYGHESARVFLLIVYT